MPAATAKRSQISRRQWMNGRIIQLGPQISLCGTNRTTERSLAHVCLSHSNVIKMFICKSSNGAGLTKRGNNRTNDAVGHHNSEDTHHPGISCPEMELTGLVLRRHNAYINISVSISGSRDTDRKHQKFNVMIAEIHISS